MTNIYTYIHVTVYYFWLIVNSDYITPHSLFSILNAHFNYNFG